MEEIFKVPEGITVKKEGKKIIVVGKLGEAKADFSNPHVHFSTKDNEIIFKSDTDTRKSKRLVETYFAQMKNMINGVENGFTYKMKVCFIHFPITVKLEGNLFLIENFLGERVPRKAKIFQGVKVVINKQDITLTGPDIYAVSQSAANIEQAARITGKDRRVFQDGIYITSKNE